MVDYFRFVLTITYLFSTIIKFSLCRGIDSPQIIIEELRKLLNQPFEVKKTLLLLKNNLDYEIDVHKIYPVFIYSNFSTSNNSIILNDTKIILYIESLLSIKSQNCYESISNIIVNKQDGLVTDLSITMEINFSEFSFVNLPEDNSYIPFYEFIENNITKSIHLELKKFENYKFVIKDNEFNFIDKKNFFEIYENQLANILIYYPVCDGLYYFNKLKEYLCKNKFDIKLPDIFYSYTVEKGEVLSVNYLMYNKVNKTISQFTNVNITFTYNIFEEYSYDRYYYTKSCLYSEIFIFNNTVEFIRDIKETHCDYLDIKVLETMINKTKEAIEPYL